MSELADYLNGAGAPPAPGAGIFVQGTVTDNADKNQPGMVKVEFTGWKTGSSICQWMPVLRGYAGKDYGVYCVPEVGDVVLVGFLSSEYRRPFVAGCFFPANASLPGKQFEDKNTKKALCTKGGVKIEVSEASGEAAVTAVTPGGLKLCAEDKPQRITLSDKNGKNLLRIDAKSNAIEITADAKLTLKTGKCQISMDGKSGAMKLSCTTLDVKANQTATLAANQSMTVQGGMVKVDGKQTTQVSGGTMTQVKGAVLKLN
jgi:uncharacterized protein involved in type VI secretion and phage assembly